MFENAKYAAKFTADRRSAEAYALIGCYTVEKSDIYIKKCSFSCYESVEFH